MREQWKWKGLVAGMIMAGVRGRSWHRDYYHGHPHDHDHYDLHHERYGHPDWMHYDGSIRGYPHGQYPYYY